jgi:putative ATP-binding cassette transporter
MAARYFRRSRDSYDEVQQGVNGLIYGAKELKLNQAKAENFHRAALHEPEMRSLSDNLKGGTILAFTQSYGEVAFFLVISFVIFQMRYSSELTVAELHGLTMALMYLAGPVTVIFTALGELNRGNISLRKLGEFYRELNDERAEGQSSITADWTRLTVRNLCYTYTRTADAAPILKNASMTFSRGQIAFIVGGNGSGKSTLGKCLSFHYIPTDGSILLDEMQVDDGNRGTARGNVSAIFTDYYLFRRLYAQADEAAQTKISGYLTYLELEDKVSLVGDNFNTINLSDGQRKRMALLVLLLEDRPICIFDEWAADQDPRFKEFFYSVILRDLKEQNKLVVVISHDDRYFDCADQIIWMENGTVSTITTKQMILREYGADAATMLA